MAFLGRLGIADRINARSNYLRDGDIELLAVSYANVTFDESDTHLLPSTAPKAVSKLP